MENPQKGSADDDSFGKSRIDQLAESKSFDYFVERKVKEKIASLSRYYKGFAALIFAVLCYFGISSFQISSEVNQYKVSRHRMDSLKTEYENYIKLAKQADSLYHIRSDLIKSINETREKLIEGRENLMAKMETKLTGLINEFAEMKVKERIEDATATADRAEELVLQSQHLIDLTERKLNILSPQVEALAKVSEETKTVSSIRYLFVERGDKQVSGKEYRPARIQIPFTDDILESRFHFVNRTKSPKIVTLDFYLNNNLLKDDIVFRDYGIPDLDNTFEFTSSGNRYSLEPVFVYLPPNTPLAWNGKSAFPVKGRIPDFVILQLRALEFGNS